MDTERNPYLDGGTHAQFPSQTHWTLIVACGHASTEGQAALNELCQIYWFPVYAFIRRKGNESHKAKDLTQAFFVHLIRKNLVAKADRQRGRFRSFLCVALKNFLIDGIRSERRDRVLISIDESEAEGKYIELPVHEPDPAKLFDRIWAASVIQQAMGKLRQAYVGREKSEAYEILQRCIRGEFSSDSYPQLAIQLGMTKETFEVNLSRFRKSFGRFIRNVIAETVEPEEIEDEIKYLMNAWASQLERIP